MDPLERNVFGHPLAGPLRERQFEEVLFKIGCEKTNMGASIRGQEAWFFLVGLRG